MVKTVTLELEGIEEMFQTVKKSLGVKSNPAVLRILLAERHRDLKRGAGT